MNRPHHSSYPMSVSECDDLARELSEYGYCETAEKKRDPGRATPVWRRHSKILGHRDRA